MLTRWLTFITSLAASANLGSAASARGSVTVSPTCRVKGEPEQELVLGCGDGKHPGVVQFWHTPFGDLQTPALHTELDPVFLHHNGSLLIPSCSIHHSGLYYCVLHHAEGSTLWSYDLHVGHHHQNGDVNEQDTSYSAHRLRRSVGLEEEHPAEISDELFAGAVVASVLLTFVVGFSAGALARTHVLRCLRGITMRLRLPKKRHRQTDTPDHSSQVTMATLPPMYDNQSFETEVMHDDSPTRGTPETTASVTTPSPPAKPQRSFRHKREEEPETAAYLEGCDYKQEENIEGEVVEKDVNERSDEEVMDDKETTELSFHLLEDEGIQSEADEDNCREERKEEPTGEQESRSKEEVKRDEHEAEQITVEVREKEKCEELEKTSTESEDQRTNKNEMKNDTEEEKMSSSAPRRNSRVIRLYQYDDDGQRYSHLPEPGCEDPEPAARLKRRSLSLTRLNAIMAAASAGPMDGKETGGQQNEEPLHFHMEI